MPMTNAKIQVGAKVDVEIPAQQTLDSIKYYISTEQEPLLKNFYSNLQTDNLWQIITKVLIQIIGDKRIDNSVLAALILDIFATDPSIKLDNNNCSDGFKTLNLKQSIVNYLNHIATKNYRGNMLYSLCYSANFQALILHKITNAIWHKGKHSLAQYIQSQISKILRIDIHPLAIIGEKLLIPDCSGIVIGATAVVENNVTIYSNVTLGGSGKDSEDRHPKVRSNVYIGSGAQLLGNIEIGAGSNIAPDSVVLKPLPANSKVAGVPARLV